ncbi:TetR/AcrR family transcriptional regulator [Humibacter sp. RRB41]|uniref:TetR/AcrR family transcriptional regulator n=1 Tax=Humibacter sp. RRB41 TaxID=2919946 RepID=UPI001FAA4AA3|nr:TetR/AcrR family transcriptional regulator [Humibacter sp. RRB41]
MTESIAAANAATDKPARQWGRTQQTRRVILDAARDVFIEEGYADANIAHIVERSGLSVGSVYHHFNGKADLFLALWDEFETVYTEAATTAVADARHSGVSDPIELFIAGTRAYLEVARGASRLTLLFRGGDGPPGYDTLGRRVGAEWMKNNTTLLGLEDTPVSRLKVRILISTVVEGERAIASVESPSEIDTLIDEAISIVRSIASL